MVEPFVELESEARRISQSSDNPTVAKLAEIVMQLCDMCKDMEEKIKKLMMKPGEPAGG